MQVWVRLLALCDLFSCEQGLDTPTRTWIASPDARISCRTLMLSGA